MCQGENEGVALNSAEYKSVDLVGTITRAWAESLNGQPIPEIFL